MDIHTFKRWSDKVQVGTKDECWEWTAGKNQDGYGQIKCGGKNKLAHRLAYEHFTGRQLGKNLCCHTCDNPSCVNPNCLFAGTHQDNVDDCVRKGRRSHAPPANKILSSADLDLIRRFPGYRGCLRFLGRWFGVSHHTVESIRARKGRYSAT